MEILKARWCIPSEYRFEAADAIMKDERIIGLGTNLSVLEAIGKPVTVGTVISALGVPVQHNSYGCYIKPVKLVRKRHDIDNQINALAFALEDTVPFVDNDSVLVWLHDDEMFEKWFVGGSGKLRSAKGTVCYGVAQELCS